MKRIVLMAATVTALVLAGSAGAALVPWTFVQAGQVCSPVSTFNSGVLHLEKPCTTPTVASAGATITGVGGQTFTSGSFTLANASQCQGGSPRFNLVTTNGMTTTTFFLGCNNVTPTTNATGTVTYTFTAATIAAAGNQVPFPTGTIAAADVLIDVQGAADLSAITVNGQAQVPATSPTAKSQCKHGGWKSFTSPTFKNQGQCVSSFEHQLHSPSGQRDHDGHSGAHGAGANGHSHHD
jgi:hypothetical protein